MAVVLLEMVGVHQTSTVPMSLETAVIVLSGMEVAAHLETAILLLAEVLLHALPQTTVLLAIAAVHLEEVIEEGTSEEVVLHAVTAASAEAVASVVDIDNET